MPYTLAQLNIELTTDPTNVGYSASIASGDDTTTANLINFVTGSIQVKRLDITPAEILEQIDYQDFVTGSNPAHISWFESATQQRSLRLVADDGTDTRILKNIKQLLLPNGAAGAAPQSRARLNAVALRSGSRAEQLWGAGTIVTIPDIGHALRG
jgi:hypothetical protein